MGKKLKPIHKPTLLREATEAQRQRPAKPDRIRMQSRMLGKPSKQPKPIVRPAMREE